MYDFIKGEIKEISPAHLVLQNQNIGYYINISVNTYSGISDKSSCLIYIHEVIREDSH